MNSEVFWGAVAQVAPVLGLACVLEIRQMLKSAWAVPRWLRVPSGLLFFFSLVSVAVLTLVSLAVLSGVIESTHFLERAALQVIGITISIAVVTPAISALYMVVAHPVSLAYSVAPILRFQIWRVSRSTRQLHALLRETRLRTVSTRLTATMQITRMLMNIQTAEGYKDDAIRGLSRHPPPKDKRRLLLYMEDLDAYVKTSQEDIEHVRTILREEPKLPMKLEVAIGESEERIRRMEEHLRELRRKRKIRMEELLLSMSGVERSRPRVPDDEIAK